MLTILLLSHSGYRTFVFISHAYRDPSASSGWLEFECLQYGVDVGIWGLTVTPILGRYLLASILRALAVANFWNLIRPCLSFLSGTHPRVTCFMRAHEEDDCDTLGMFDVFGKFHRFIGPE